MANPLPTSGLRTRLSEKGKTHDYPGRKPPGGHRTLDSSGGPLAPVHPGGKTGQRWYRVPQDCLRRIGPASPTGRPVRLSVCYPPYRARHERPYGRQPGGDLSAGGTPDVRLFAHCHLCCCPVSSCFPRICACHNAPDRVFSVYHTISTLFPVCRRRGGACAILFSHLGFCCNALTFPR